MITKVRLIVVLIPFNLCIRVIQPRMMPALPQCATASESCLITTDDHMQPCVARLSCDSQARWCHEQMLRHVYPVIRFSSNIVNAEVSEY